MGLQEAEKNRKEAECNDSSLCSDEKMKEQSQNCSCQDSPCCGSSRLLRAIKSAIFALVMLMAIGVTAWSLLKKNTTQGVGQTDKQFEGNETLQQLCGTILDSLDSLNEVAADKDFVFVLLPGIRSEDPENAVRAIEQTSETLSGKGIRVGTFTIKRDNPDYKKVVSSLGIEKLPAVLLMGRGCGANVVTGEITEDRLLKGYLLASTPSSCCPGSPGAESCR